MKEPAVIYASAITYPCAAHCNASTTMNRYGTRDNLGSTGLNTFEANNSLSTVINSWRHSEE